MSAIIVGDGSVAVTHPDGPDGWDPDTDGYQVDPEPKALAESSTKG